jgi:polyhydroxyalkanoate synthesis regulator phasin
MSHWPVAWLPVDNYGKGPHMQEALRTYMELAMGLTDVSRKRVKKVVKEAVGRGGATAEQVKALTSELRAANSANRETLAKIVRFEVDRALGVVGLATADEVGELTARVRELEKQLRAAESRADGVAVESANGAAPAPSTAAKKTAKKTVAKKTAAKTSGTTARTAKKTAAKKAPAKTTAARKAPAKTAAAKKAVAKKAPARKAPAKKAAGAPS